MTFREALKTIAAESLRNLGEMDMWGDMVAGLVAVFLLAVRLAVLVTFPISLPLIAWLMIVDEQKRAREFEALRAKLRRGMHQNGPGT